MPTQGARMRGTECDVISFHYLPCFDWRLRTGKGGNMFVEVAKTRHHIYGFILLKVHYGVSQLAALIVLAAVQVTITVRQRKKSNKNETKSLVEEIHN